MELFFEVANRTQIKEVMYDAPLKEELQLHKKTQDYKKIYLLSRQIPSLTKTLIALFQKNLKRCKQKLPSGEVQKYYEHIEEDEEWRAYLVNDIIGICITYLRDHKLISSKAHERVTDEFKDLINVEIARGFKIPLNERVKGFV